MVYLVALLLLSLPASAANWYLAAEATGASDNGTSWATGPNESTGDGLQLDTSEGITASRRPLLTIRTQ